MAINIFAAAIEEVGFRGGLVHSLERLFSSAIALACGGIVFGLAHFFNRFFRQPFIPMHVVAATFAGFMFSALYLQFDLLCAIGAHWGWNSLCRGWTEFFDLDPHNGVQAFEGAWTTSILMLTIAAFLTTFPQPLVS
ncbi:CPBP family intramembrane glutamic endopeptidase [Bradyrhizobium sp. Pa8]|uniref:lysostaphin resistance A-like protein n=1 Tax=Bradyrhizobium sp. Pa8 TaxID=3386552 RepID=UPI00403F591F